MWQAYWSTVRESPLDWVILGLGLFLILAHLVGLVGRLHGGTTLFVQGLNSYRTFCLLLTDLLPILGLLGTVLSLMFTFKTFQTLGSDGSEGGPDLSGMIRAFAPAMSTTISGLLMIAPNLVLNAILWLLRAPSADEAEGG